MAYITIDCRKQERTFSNRQQATEHAIRQLHSMSVGTVAAVWEGDEQTVGLQVKRLLKEPTIILRDKWPRETAWRVANVGHTYSSTHTERLTKAANR